LKPAFWDSSSLVPLCLQQHPSAVVRQLARRYSIAVWWATPVEVRSAFARLSRMGALDSAGWQLADATLTALRGRWREIAPDEHLRLGAEMLLPRFPLRAADALQLAAAMTWAMDQPRGRVFISGDAQLLAAARQLGFQAIEA